MDSAATNKIKSNHSSCGKRSSACPSVRVLRLRPSPGWMQTSSGQRNSRETPLHCQASLTAHNVPRRERRCPRNVVGGGIVSCILGSLSTVCSFGELPPCDWAEPEFPLVHRWFNSGMFKGPIVCKNLLYQCFFKKKL